MRSNANSTFSFPALIGSAKQSSKHSCTVLYIKSKVLHHVSLSHPLQASLLLSDLLPFTFITLQCLPFTISRPRCLLLLPLQSPTPPLEHPFLHPLPVISPSLERTTAGIAQADPCPRSCLHTLKPLLHTQQGVPASQLHSPCTCSSLDSVSTSCIQHS